MLSMSGNANHLVDRETVCKSLGKINTIYVNSMFITKLAHIPKCRHFISDVTKKRRLKEMHVQPRVRRMGIGPIMFPNVGVCYTCCGSVYFNAGNSI